MDWSEVLGPEKQQPYFQALWQHLQTERSAGKQIYPEQSKIFDALKLTSFEQVKVVILGQDPYHGPGQAEGLSFSVPAGIPHPPSLQNIFKELQQDLGIAYPKTGSLRPWAQQGVLLLNTILTVEGGKAQSHQNLGWQNFTDRLIQQLNQHRQGLVFLLWGSHAQKKQELIDASQHFILKSPHPSPLSAHRGFFGCRHFSKTNQLLAQQGLEPIDWALDPA